MGVLDKVGGIFGGSSSSKSNPATVYGAQEPFLQNLWDRSQMASYGNMGSNFANQINQGALPGYNQQMQGGMQIPGLQQGLMNFGQQQNEALGGAIQSGLGQINRNFQRNIMPSINTGAAMSNTSGGSRQGIAQGLAASDANQQASDFVNQMMSQNFQGMQQNQLGAYGQLGQLQAQQNLAQQGALGMAPQLSNLGFGSQYGDLAALSSLIGSPTVLGGGGSSSGQGGIGSSLGGIASLTSVLSDIRAKENIKRVGKTDSGLNVYTYNYKGHPQTHMGVMAQEVEESIPEAVHEFNGLKTVDYTKVV
ncbi:MAG: tail fiber domain-containing protein [Gammaproteobacteria bacterium]|nr:tail fiber domain-containing protein [Gammaproteobacteria bacterium]